MSSMKTIKLILDFLSNVNSKLDTGVSECILKIQLSEREREREREESF